MASRYPLIVDSSAGQIKEIAANDHIVFDSAAGSITALILQVVIIFLLRWVVIEL
jgi:hypothetical protein